MYSSKIHPKPDSSDISKFIRDTFKARQCNKFVMKQPDKSNVCHCGYDKIDHTLESFAQSGRTDISDPVAWKASDDIVAYPTDAYGQIVFRDYAAVGISNMWRVKRFVRLEHNSDPEKMQELFQKYWNIDDPDIIISLIHGKSQYSDDEEDKSNEDAKQRRSDRSKNGIKNFLSKGKTNFKSSNEQAVKLLSENLAETAALSNAWLITDGTYTKDSNLIRIVGTQIEEVAAKMNKKPKAVIGISNWGCLKDKHFLVNANYIQYSHQTDSDYFIITSDESSPLGSIPERNHSHFVFVDDGQQFQPGCEIQLRLKLEQGLRKWNSTADSLVPLIYIVMGGDLKTIATVKKVLDNNLPVIILMGSGGVVDIFAECLDNKGCSETVFKNKLKEMFILRPRKSIGWELVKKYFNDEELYAKLKTTKGELKRALEDLCYIQNSKKDLLMIHPANSETALGETILKAVREDNLISSLVLAADWGYKDIFGQLLLKNSEGRRLEEVMCKLLLRNRYSFVEILLDRIDLRAFIRDAHDLRLNELEFDERFSSLRRKISRSNDKMPNETECCDEKISKLLFIWSVYNGRKEIAEQFWITGKDFLAMSLLAYKASQTKQVLELESKIEGGQAQAQCYEKMACDFVKFCYKQNPRNTLDLLVGRIPDLDGLTPMRIALEGDCKKFVALIPCQDLLQEIWVQNIVKYNRQYRFPLAISIICPFIAPKLFTFHDEDNTQIDDDSTDIDEDEREARSYLWKLNCFLNAPIVKVIYTTVSYMAYLTLFSIVMLTNFYEKMGVMEILLTIWTFILLLEEVRQIVTDYKVYISIWNIYDLVSLINYLVGLILRLVYHFSASVCPKCLYVARIFLAFSLLTFFFRMLQFLALLKIIFRLLRDLISFMLIMMVFVAAYGVVSNVILFPNQPLDATLLQDVFYDAWWSVIQQFNREDTLGENCEPNDKYTAEYCSSPSEIKDQTDYIECKAVKCPANNWIVSVLLAFYALFTCIMMLNVLIAMFNITFEKVRQQQDEVSKMQRYILIKEYSSKSMIPPPFCIIAYLRCIPWCIRLCKRCVCSPDDKLIIPVSPLQSSNSLRKPFSPRIRLWECKVFEKFQEHLRDQERRTLATIQQEDEDGETKTNLKLMIQSPEMSSDSPFAQLMLDQIERRIKNILSSFESTALWPTQCKCKCAMEPDKSDQQTLSDNARATSKMDSNRSKPTMSTLFNLRKLPSNSGPPLSISRNITSDPPTFPRSSPPDTRSVTPVEDHLEIEEDEPHLIQPKIAEERRSKPNKQIKKAVKARPIKFRPRRRRWSLSSDQFEIIIKGKNGREVTFPYKAIPDDMSRVRKCHIATCDADLLDEDSEEPRKIP